MKIVVASLHKKSDDASDVVKKAPAKWSTKKLNLFSDSSAPNKGTKDKSNALSDSSAPDKQEKINQMCFLTQAHLLSE